MNDHDKLEEIARLVSEDSASPLAIEIRKILRDEPFDADY